MGAGPTTAVTGERTILLLVQDLIFSVRIADTARAAGYTPVDTNLEDLAAAAGAGAVLIVVDTGYRGDWQAAIRALKSDTRTATIPVLAYGSHVDVTASRAAVAVGCDRLVTRGKLVAELPKLLEATAQP